MSPTIPTTHLELLVISSFIKKAKKQGKTYVEKQSTGKKRSYYAQ